MGSSIIRRKFKDYWQVLYCGVIFDTIWGLEKLNKMKLLLNYTLKLLRTTIKLYRILLNYIEILLNYIEIKVNYMDTYYLQRHQSAIKSTNL